MNTPCIETPNRRDRNGYGRTTAHRFGRRITHTHVVAWVDAHGQLPPPGKPSVLHRCDNPPCIRPDHLYAGTQADNNRDMVARGRVRNGNQGKTHCKHGHEFTPENTYAHGAVRYCRTCRYIRIRDRDQRLRMKVS